MYINRQEDLYAYNQSHLIIWIYINF